MQCPIVTRVVTLQQRMAMLEARNRISHYHRSAFERLPGRAYGWGLLDERALLRLQGPDGAWRRNGRPDAQVTARALITLLQRGAPRGPDDERVRAIRAGIAWLLAHQDASDDANAQDLRSLTNSVRSLYESVLGGTRK